VHTDGEFELKPIARLDEAVAPMVTGDWASVLSASAPNVIVWLPLAMANVRLTRAAELYVPLPAWSASIVQSPACSRVMTPPLVTEQAVEAVE
jgi:hypothetical protein